MPEAPTIHGSCVARDGAAILILGPPGSGKSDLALRLLGRGFALVADDRVALAAGVASAPPALLGLLEVRGLGLTRLPPAPPARVALVVRLGEPPPRLPAPLRDPDLGALVVRLDAAQASAPDKAILALDCALGRAAQTVGAFAA